MQSSPGRPRRCRAPPRPRQRACSAGSGRRRTRRRRPRRGISHRALRHRRGAAQTRRLSSEPSSAIANAVRRAAWDSATMSVESRGDGHAVAEVDAVGNLTPHAFGRYADDRSRRGSLSGHHVVAAAVDERVPPSVHDDLVDRSLRHDTGEIRGPTPAFRHSPQPAWFAPRRRSQAGYRREPVDGERDRHRNPRTTSAMPFAGSTARTRRRAIANLKPPVVPARRLGKAQPIEDGGGAHRGERIELNPRRQPGRPFASPSA